MEIDWQNLLESLGVYSLTLAFGSGLVYFIVKGLITNRINKDLEDYKRKLHEQLEDYKHKLEIEKIRFSKIHETQATVISKVYALLNSAHRDFQRLTAMLQTYESDDPENMKSEDEVKLKSAGDSLQSLVDHFNENRIWLPEKLTIKIDDFTRKLLNVGLDHQSWKEFRIVDPEYARENHKKVLETMESVIPDLRTDLEVLMKKVLLDPETEG